MKKDQNTKKTSAIGNWIKQTAIPRISQVIKPTVTVIGRQKWLRYAFFPLVLCFFELMIHIFSLGGFTDKLVWIMLFALGIGAIPTFFTTVFSSKANLILTYVFTVFFTLMFEIQLVYHQIFQGYASLSSAKMAGQAVTNFTDAMFEGIRSCLGWIILFLLPLAVLIIAHVVYKPKLCPPKKRIFAFIPLLAAALIISGTIGVMVQFFNGRINGFSKYQLFISSTTDTTASVNCFGLTITMFQELRYLVFPKDDPLPPEELSTIVYDENVDQVDPNVDFLELYKKAGDNEDLKALTAALSNMPVSKKNEYTGICKDYNIVAICAEAFSPEFIDPELTPTLYKLTTNGFIFENFYATFPNVTTNGEYTFCMGLFPDLTRTKTDSSFNISALNYLPYCYGNIYKENGGIAKAYHNYIQEFYFRNFTHPNMGYDFKAANSGLGIKITWPTSDHEMFVNSVEEYVTSDKPFAAYYMTFSGHYQYTLDNTMSAKNWDEVQHIEASDKVKAYIACNLELEKALAHLMQRLEEEGVADKTMIVLTTDHFPYGLSTEEYSELAGRPIENIFDQQKNAFICYVPGMEPVVVDEYCSTQDILPTILNLLGVTYDSRLLAGVDVLSPDVVHMAIIADGSYLTEGISFEASTVTLTLSEDTTEMRLRADDLYALMKKRLRISVEILNNNYYSFVFGKESSNQSIQNVTANFSDVNIMKQPAVNYLITNGYMDAVSEKKFGSEEKATIAETLDIAYRIADRPAYTVDSSSLPFDVPEKYQAAAAWAYENYILSSYDFPDDLNTSINFPIFAKILYRLADYMEMDITVDSDELDKLVKNNPGVTNEMLKLYLFCSDHFIMNDNGADAHLIYTNPDKTIKRHYVAEEFYKLCSWYLFVGE